MDWLQELLSRLTYSIGPQNPGALLALFALGLLTDIGFPFPFILETFLFLASYSLGPVSTQVMFALLMLLSGRETGSAILYFVSRGIGQRLISWLGKHNLRLSRNLGKFRSRLAGHTVISVATVRLTPGLLQVPSLIAGSMRLSYLRFFFGVAISALTWDFGLIILGFFARLIALKAGKATEIYVIAGSLCIIIAAWVILFLRFREDSSK